MHIRTLILVAVALTAGAQTFEVASVKSSGSERHPLGIGLFTYPGGRIVASLCPLDYLIQEAFQLQRFQISGGPRWIHEDEFDLEAKPPASSSAAKSAHRSPKLPPNAEQRKMLQALLTDRFQLQYRIEIREGPVYFLIRTNKELKLQQAKDKEAYPWVGNAEGKGAIYGSGIAGTNATMALLAERLSPYLGRPVIDKTGIEGAYDFKSEYHSEEPRPDIVSSILTSVQGLGLKLETARGPVETFVIERVEKPVGN